MNRKPAGGAAWRNLYLHVPFCASKCAYCAFYSEPGAPDELQEAWLEKIVVELGSAAFSEPVQTVYLGGGTPTVLTEPRLERLLAALRRYVPLTPDAEVSSEANPESFTPEKAAILRTFVNRISLGVQRFSPLRRRQLGRKADQETLLAALERVREMGFPRYSFDLIYGIAGETQDEWLTELEAALQYRPEHLSCYALTPEENTRLALETPETAADDEAGAERWLETGQRLAAAGLPRYEISNYARPGAFCRHNQAVWRGENLLGLGPAASGFDGFDRCTEVSDLRRWLAGTPAEPDVIAPAARQREILAVNLRTENGWTPDLWERREIQQLERRPWRTLLDEISRRAEAHPAWWRITADRIALTPEGLLFWNEIAGDLLPE